MAPELSHAHHTSPHHSVCDNGKSTSGLSIAERVAKRVSQIKGKDPLYYFDPRKNCLALEDTSRIAETLRSLPKHSILMVDDAGVAAGSRAAMTRNNQNMSNLIAVCRTSRLLIIWTIPSKNQLDCAIRSFVDYTCHVVKSCHAAGFNVVKIYSNSNGIKGREYMCRVAINKTPVDVWAICAPSEETQRLYEIEREESAKRLNDRIINTGTTATERIKPHSEKPMGRPRVSEEERNKNTVDKYGLAYSTYMRDHPKASGAVICAALGMHHTELSRLKVIMGVV